MSPWVLTPSTARWLKCNLKYMCALLHTYIYPYFIRGTRLKAAAVPVCALLTSSNLFELKSIWCLYHSRTSLIISSKVVCIYRCFSQGGELQSRAFPFPTIPLFFFWRVWFRNMYVFFFVRTSYLSFLHSASSLYYFYSTSTYTPLSSYPVIFPPINQKKKKTQHQTFLQFSISKQTPKHTHTNL